jgi:hypothetical protein
MELTHLLRCHRPESRCYEIVCRRTLPAASRVTTLPRDSRALLEISIKSGFFFDLRLTYVLVHLFQASLAKSPKKE